jgi:hypothetical protein
VTNLNLHGLVRGAITSVNADVSGIVYVSQGATNNRGIMTPNYTPVNAALQVQAQKHTPLTQERGLNYTNGLLTVWAYGHFDDLSRPDQTGGSIAYFRGLYWYITQFLEFWPGWCSFEVTRQLNAADLNQLLAYLKQTESV